MRQRLVGLSLFLMVTAMLASFAHPVYGVAAVSSHITLDGQFADWEGKAHMDDQAYDAFPSGDITRFYWATNDGESNLYFMIERRGWGDLSAPLPTIYQVNLDISDNGIYHNGNDRYLIIHYNPLLDGQVLVSLYKGNGNLLKTYSGDWGESTPQGGRKCEFSVSMDDLHMFPAQSQNVCAEFSSYK